MPMTVLVTAMFIAVPVFALFRAASIRWTGKLAVLLVVCGVLVHVGLQFLGGYILGGRGISGALTLSLRDVGFFTWCVGLGALLTLRIKDRNMLIPISIALVALDVFLVLTPIGPVKMVLQIAPEIPQAMALNLPQASSQATGGAALPFAIIGPADFVFMAMFFIALFKFGLNVRRTAVALVPAMLAYMLLVLWLGAIPMLVPIGITVLAVNWSEFKLNVEEWASTALIAALAGGLIWWGATRPAPQVEILQTGPGPAIPGSEGSPERASPGLPRS